MWLIISVLAAVQMVGLMTIWHFKSKVKEVESENEQLKKVVVNGTHTKPAWEELGLTEEEYKQTRNMVYAIDKPNIPLYIPGIDDVEILEEETSLNELHEMDEPVQPEKSELSELLGIEDQKELEELQKAIEEAQQNIEEAPLPVPPPNDEAENHDELFEETSAITTEITEELQKIMNEIEDEQQTPMNELEPQVAPMGDALDLFDEISQSINQETDVPISFSDDNLPTFDGTEVLPSDADAPVYEPEEHNVVEQARMIHILNLLDTEASRMNQELDLTEVLDENVLERQEIATRLAMLSSEEGTNNMREIVKLISRLYELEGKEADMKALREEYSEYFEDTDAPIQIFEEDIISTEKESEEKPFYIPEKYLWLASAKITDGVQGKQRWVGRVIGFNDNSGLKFIHFRDVSQRIWINISELNVTTFSNGDILTMFINRDGKNIIAEDIQVIKKIEN